MDNFLLLSILGVLTIYFYSSMNVYKSLYRKVTEEKMMVEEIKCVVCGEFPHEPLECGSCHKLLCKYC